MHRREFIAATFATGAACALAPVRSLAQEAGLRAKPSNLKITGVKTFIVNAASVNWVFCKVYTNQGLVGLGEGSVTSKEATVAGDHGTRALPGG